MNWYIGQKVVCVKSDFAIMEGETYTITNIIEKKCKCKPETLLEVGIPFPGKVRDWMCLVCNTSITDIPATIPYLERFFAPLDSKTDELSDYTPYSLIRELDKVKIEELCNT